MICCWVVESILAKVAPHAVKRLYEEPCSDTNWKDLIGLEGGWIGVSKKPETKKLKLRKLNACQYHQQFGPVLLV